MLPKKLPKPADFPGKPAMKSTSTDNGRMFQNVTTKKQAFLAAFVESGSISHAAKAADTSRTSHYRWMEESEEYREIFEAAKEDALENLEREARFRAVEGLRQYKFDRDGNPLKHPVTGKPYFEEKRSDVLLIFLLKALAPEKYRERNETKLSGDVNLGGGVRIVEDDNWYGNRDRIAELKGSVLGTDPFSR